MVCLEEQPISFPCSHSRINTWWVKKLKPWKFLSAGKQAVSSAGNEPGILQSSLVLHQEAGAHIWKQSQPLQWEFALNERPLFTPFMLDASVLKPQVASSVLLSDCCRWVSPHHTLISLLQQFAEVRWSTQGFSYPKTLNLAIWGFHRDFFDYLMLVDWIGKLRKTYLFRFFFFLCAASLPPGHEGGTPGMKRAFWLSTEQNRSGNWLMAPSVTKRYGQIRVSTSLLGEEKV